MIMSKEQIRILQASCAISTLFKRQPECTGLTPRLIVEWYLGKATELQIDFDKLWIVDESHGDISDLEHFALEGIAQRYDLEVNHGFREREEATGGMTMKKSTRL